MATISSRRQRFCLYPEPIRAPDVPYKNDRKPNPRIRGWVLLVAAFVVEWFGFVRRMVWRNAGFGSLSNIFDHIKDTEPLFDPTVFPLEPTALEPGNDPTSTTGDVNLPESSHSSSVQRRYTTAHYRSLYLSLEVTPLDVVNAILPLIRRDTLPPGEHSLAWFDVRADLVVKAAEASTLRYQEGRSLGPLDGVPTAVKDEYDVVGYGTNLGSINEYAGKDANGDTIDTWCVRKLKDAGAIILGKLSMHEFGMDTSGNNITYGTPRNPYNQNYYTGGSSSGSAYAVAAGLIPIAMGSDGGGSVRIPSSFCSVYGLKPTHGRLSHFPGQNHSSTCSVNGPIAADMRSLAALFSVVGEPHPSSHFRSLLSLESKLVHDTRQSKVIGIPETWFRRATPAVQELCRGTIDRLVKYKGYTTVPIEIPFLPEGQIAHALTILTDAAGLLPVTRGLSPANRVLLALGRETRSTDYLLAQKLRRVLMQHLAWLWQQHPGMLICTPTTGCAGWPIRSSSELQYGVSDGDQTLATMEYVWLANFCGVPSISVPTGFTIPEGRPGEGEVAEVEETGKVPVGLMAAGEWASEYELIQFGIDVEDVSKEQYSLPPGWVDVIKLATEHQATK